MTSIQQAESTSSPGRAEPAPQLVRFSLSWLLLLITLIALLLAIARWDLTASVLVAGVIAAWGGYKHELPLAVVLGTVVALGSFAQLAMDDVTIAKWTGRPRFTVYVLVVDAGSLERIPDAEIELLKGPPGLHEWHRKVDVEEDFQTVPIAGAPNGLRTDHDGYANFVQPFFGSGTDGGWAYATTTGYWLRVTTPGRTDTLFPMEREVRFHSETEDRPVLFFTIPVAKE